MCDEIMPHESMAAVLTIRPVENPDLPVGWAPSVLPNVGKTRRALRCISAGTGRGNASRAFDDMVDPGRTFTGTGGELVVAEVDGHIAAMGGFRPVAKPGQGTPLA